MKILKIFGIVVGIHVFALILIFANPGCSSTKTPPSPGNPAAKTAAAPVVSPPTAPAAAPQPPSSAISFKPDTPAVTAPINVGARLAPTRPASAAAGVLVSEPVTDV